MDSDNECDDITFFAKEMKQADGISPQEASILRELVVTLKAPVLPQHEIETRAGSRPPSKEERSRFMKLAPLRNGSYAPYEDEIIVKNWKDFCKMHNWDHKNVKPFLLLRQTPNKSYIRSKRQRRRFVQFLANGLPNRTLYSIYHRFRTLYDKHNQKRYDPEEDRMILDHIENNPYLDEKRKYADLAVVLKRTRGSVWRRYKLLKKKRQIKEQLT